MEKFLHYVNVDKLENPRSTLRFKSDPDVTEDVYDFLTEEDYFRLLEEDAEKW